MESAGMVDVAALEPALAVSLMYARDDNFTGAAMYPEAFNRAYLHPEAAAALAKAQATLTETHPGLRILIADAARPMSVQRKMYQTVRGTPQAPYVSNPANGGGLHNYGLAVDVTIVDALGRPLPMGTKVDHLGPEAHIDSEEAMVKAGTITAAELENRKLLRRVMKAGGFMPLRSEWWHFNLRSRAEARRRYPLLDF
ncbi:MAG: M15 family metallopeptidase [Alloprevotella sp.]|nr:M15 family metallopeptidase [Alloprevotella sp.]